MTGQHFTAAVPDHQSYGCEGDKTYQRTKKRSPSRTLYSYPKSLLDTFMKALYFIWLTRKGFDHAHSRERFLYNSVYLSQLFLDISRQSAKTSSKEHRRQDD